jgi:thiamine pyrophosphokinase
MKVENRRISNFIDVFSDLSQSAVVFLGGELENEWLARELAPISKFFVCADSGAEHARKLDLVPDAVVGDFDSVTYGTLNHFEDKNCEIVEIPDQESNDFEKALHYIWERFQNLSPTEKVDMTVFILGMTGGRTDHALANFSVMLRYTDLFKSMISFELGAEHRFLTTANNNCKIDCEIGTTISLTPFGEARRIVTENLQYPLSGETLLLGMREGLSNFSTGSPVTIAIESGALLVSVVDDI